RSGRSSRSTGRSRTQNYFLALRARRRQAEDAGRSWEKIWGNARAHSAVAEHCVVEIASRPGEKRAANRHRSRDAGRGVRATNKLEKTRVFSFRLGNTGHRPVWRTDLGSVFRSQRAVIRSRADNGSPARTEEPHDCPMTRDLWGGPSLRSGSHFIYRAGRSCMVSTNVWSALSSSIFTRLSPGDGRAG